MVMAEEQYEGRISARCRRTRSGERMEPRGWPRKAQAVRPVSEPPLFRVTVVNVSPQEHRLLFTIHQGRRRRMRHGADPTRGGPAVRSPLHTAGGLPAGPADPRTRTSSCWQSARRVEGDVLRVSSYRNGMRSSRGAAVRAGSSCSDTPVPRTKASVARRRLFALHRQIRWSG